MAGSEESQMEKISNNLSNLTGINPTRTNKKSSFSKNYLLNNPIQDKVQFGSDEPKSTEEVPLKKKHKALKWIIGSSIAILAGLIALKIHDSKDTQKLINDIEKDLNKDLDLDIKLNPIEDFEFKPNSSGKSGSKTSNAGGNFNSKTNYNKDIKDNDDFINNCNTSKNRSNEQTRKAKAETDATKEQLNNAKAKTTEAENLLNNINSFQQKLNNTITSKSLEELKRDIRAQKPLITNFENPSEIVDKHFRDWNEIYDEDLLINTYAYVKKMQPEIKNPIEAEKNRQCSIHLLGKLNETVDKNTADKSLMAFKKSFTKQKINEEVDDLLDHYFGKVELQPEDTKSLHIRTRQELKKMCEYSFIDIPHLSFTNNLNDVADTYLREIEYIHIKNGVISEDGKKLLKMAELLNNKAIEINNTMKTDTNYMIDGLKLIKTKIEEFKAGKFKSKSEQEWNYQNKNYTFKTSAQKQCINTFKKYLKQSEIKIEELENYDALDSLDLTKESDKKLLKKVYRKLSFKYHPDPNQGDKEAEEAFKEISDAYGKLSA